MISMRKHLFSRFLPLILGPLAVSTIWSGTMSWIKGSDGAGWAWTGQGARAFQEVYRETGELVVARLGTITEQYKHTKQPKLLHNEYFAVYKDGKVIQTNLDPAFISIQPDLLFSPIPAEDWDFYAQNQRLFFKSSTRHEGNLIIFLREFDANYLHQLHAINGAEVVLYLDLKPIFSTWRDQDDRVVLPALTENIKGELLRSEDVHSLQIKDTVGIANYRGMLIGDATHGQTPKTYEAGSSDLYSYHTFTPIKNRRGEKLAYLDIAAPQGAVIEGPIYAIVGSVVIFALLAVFSTFVVRKVASSYAKPLAVTSRGIHDMIKDIGIGSPESDGKILNKAIDSLPMEIAMLSADFEKLKHIVKAWQEAEQKLESSRKQLIHSTKMSALGEMAAGVAHEINNPLAVINSRSRHIQRVLTSNPQKIDSAIEFAKIIETSSERIDTIVRSLKSFSRSGERDPFELCKIKDLLKDTLTLCEERFTLNGVQLRIETSSDNLEFEGRSVQISQVLLNLLNNAYDAIAALPMKWIKISTEDLGHQIKISVTDSGSGIPAAIKEKIMQPFFTTKEIGKGTGLGLSVSSGIIQEHAGTLTIDETCPNTCFVVILPKLHSESSYKAA